MEHTITDYGICQVAIAPVRATASDESEIVTQLLFGDFVKVLEQGQPWIKVYFMEDDYEGWMDFKQLHYISRDEYEKSISVKHEVVTNGMIKVKGPIGEQHIIFGSNLPFLKGEIFQFGQYTGTLLEPLLPFAESFVETALRFENTPYLWGGKGIFGIDCSGFVQIVAKAHGIFLPRDASEQVEVGEVVYYNNRQAGDLMYFVNDKGSVHHLGVILDQERIIHASGHVRIDQYTESGIFRHDLNRQTHQFHSIKRIWKI